MSKIILRDYKGRFAKIILTRRGRCEFSGKFVQTNQFYSACMTTMVQCDHIEPDFVTEVKDVVRDY